MAVTVNGKCCCAVSFDKRACSAAGECTYTGTAPPPGGLPDGDVTNREDTNTPIVINLENGNLRLTDLSNPVSFDIDADGTPDTISWTEPGYEAAFLALDRNGNGVIDNGRELFGGVTNQPASAEPNGFYALGVYDRYDIGGNDDGMISEDDSVYPSLLLWTDRNHDGVSQESELEPLSARGIYGVETGFVRNERRDPYGNLLRWSSMVFFEKNKKLAATDVIFLSDVE